MQLKLKICGMKYPENVKSVLGVQPDFLGFILYDKSPRGITVRQLEHLRKLVPGFVQPILVTVNYPATELIAICKNQQISLVQLHGEEDPDYIQKLKKNGLSVIRSVSVRDQLPQEYLHTLEKDVDFFLFDTRGKYLGGNGIPFNHDILRHYSLNTPFFLGGGLNISLIKTLNPKSFQKLYALDVNSGFEIYPGMKDVRSLNALKKYLNDIMTGETDDQTD